MKTIELGKNSGFCFGVKEAIRKTEDEIRKKNDGEISGNVYTLGPLIHNQIVTDELERKGVKILSEISEARPGDTVIIRSHGEPKQVYDYAADNNINIVDATCPFVSRIHEIVMKEYASGKDILIVGDITHPEVIGINGWCENKAFISLKKEDLERVHSSFLHVVCQTTIKDETLTEIIEALDEKGIKYELSNTICNATKLRQNEATKLAKKSDLMVVIGDENSSNTKKLLEISKKYCKNVQFVEKSEYFLLQLSQKYNKIGVVAGASTPDHIIKEVIATMSEIKEMSMEELLATEEYDLDKAMKLPRLGEIVNGTVHQVTEKQIVVDMGCKKDGVIPKEEVTLEGEQKLTDLFKAGDEIQAKVVKTDDGDGVITLSTKKLDVNKHWNEIKEAYENKTTLTVKIVRLVNGGVIGQFKEATGFIPLSQLSDKFVENAESFMGQELDVKVTKIDEKKNRAVFSHKVIAQEERAQKLALVWDTLHTGDIVEGKVARFTEYGAFIDLGGIDGLLHISEISWGKLKNPQEVLKIGDMVQVMVLAMNPEKNKISLGLKQCRPEPWSVIDDKYAVDQVVCGEVVQIKEYGAFVEIEPGLDGLVHISEIAHKRVENIAEELKLGQKIEAKILEIDKEKKRISLSIKATLPEPEVKEEAPIEAPAEATEE